MIAGSSGLLAVDTLGHSSSELDRDISVGVVSDANAYLGLVDDDVETGGLLFGNGTRYPLATFDVANRLTEPIEVALGVEDDRVRFVPTSDAEASDAVTAFDLGVGEKTAVAIDLDVRSTVPPVDETITTTLEVEAEGETTHVETDRSLTLVSGVLLVVDWCSSWHHDGRLVIRKRRDLGGDCCLLVELVDCVGDERTTVAEVDASNGLLPKLRLAFPEANRSNPGRSTSKGRDDTGAPLSQSRSESASDPALVTASGVEVELEWEATLGDEKETATTGESSLPVLEVDPDGALENETSRSTEPLEVRFSKLAE
ncbi:hypothetical protein C490_05662 [Natronobacterium gregoryi SP2]|nr:hypothetical protein C490_05662 [Natronobacterium gregoryi SP2]